jgi:hypothetical protein
MAIVFPPRLLLPPLTHDQRSFFIFFSFLLGLAIQVADRPYGVVTSFARCARMIILTFTSLCKSQFFRACVQCKWCVIGCCMHVVQMATMLLN